MPPIEPTTAPDTESVDTAESDPGTGGSSTDAAYETNKLAALKEMLESATQARADWLKKGEEAEKLAYGEGYEDLYKTIEDTDFVWKAKVNRASEAVEIFGPYLYPENPAIEITPRTQYGYDVWKQTRHDIEKLYIEYAYDRGDLESEARRAVNHAILYGRFQLWTGFNQRKNIVDHQFVPVADIFLDPDAKSYAELNYIIRRREKPKWELARMFPKRKKQIMTATPCGTRTSAPSDSPSEMVEYYEAHMRVGLHHYSAKLVNEEGETDDSPAVHIFTKDFYLTEQPWPIPFHMVDEWPITLTDLRAGRCESINPEGPLFSGLPHLKALCYLYTLYLNRCRLSSRAAFMAAVYNGQGMSDEEIIKILNGKDFDVIRVKINGNELKLSDLLQQLKIDAGIPEFERMWAVVGAEWEKATGLDAMLYAGATKTQLRIAADVDLKKGQSMHRVEDMKTQMLNGMVKLARKTLFAARFLHEPADIGKRWGPEAEKIWGTLAPPELVEQERMMRDQQKQMMSEQAAMMAEQAQMQMAQMPPAPAAPGGAAPPAMPAIPPPPTPEELDQQLGPPEFVAMEEWIESFDCEIEPSSMRRMDTEAQISNLNTVLTTLAPIIAPAPGGMQVIATAFEEFTRLNRYSPSMQRAAASFKGAAEAAMMMPPPQAPTPAKESEDTGRPNKGVIAKG